MGGDVRGGPALVGAVGDCCATCAGRPGCALFSFEPWTPWSSAGVCYLKAASGWEAKPSLTMQTVALPSATLPPVPDSRPTADPTGDGYVFMPLTADQERRAYALTSLFESGQVGGRGGQVPACARAARAGVLCGRRLLGRCHCPVPSCCCPADLQAELQYGNARRTGDDRGERAQAALIVRR